MRNQIIQIYTDGSCHTQLKIGAWAALIFYHGNKEILKAVVENTTHNRMELSAVIKAIEWLKQHQIEFSEIEVYTDSQYVVKLQERKEKLKAANFISKKGTSIQNADLVKELIYILDNETVTFIKVPGHQKKTSTENFNREVDMIVRDMMRKAVLDKE